MRRATRAGPMGAPWVYYIYIYICILAIAYCVFYTYIYICILAIGYCLLLIHIHVYIAYCLCLHMTVLLSGCCCFSAVYSALLSAVYWAPRLLSQPLAGASPGAETVDGVPSRQLRAATARQ